MYFFLINGIDALVNETGVNLKKKSEACCFSYWEIKGKTEFFYITEPVVKISLFQSQLLFVGIMGFS